MSESRVMVAIDEESIGSIIDAMADKIDRLEERCKTIDSRLDRTMEELQDHLVAVSSIRSIVDGCSEVPTAEIVAILDSLEHSLVTRARGDS